MKTQHTWTQQRNRTKCKQTSHISHLCQYPTWHLFQDANISSTRCHWVRLNASHEKYMRHRTEKCTPSYKTRTQASHLALRLTKVEKRKEQTGKQYQYIIERKTQLNSIVSIYAWDRDLLCSRNSSHLQSKRKIYLNLKILSCLSQIFETKILSLYCVFFKSKS